MFIELFLYSVVVEIIIVLVAVLIFSSFVIQAINEQLGNINPTILNSLSFLFGGAGVMLLQWWRDDKKQKKCRKNALNALELERGRAIELCTRIVELLDGNTASVYSFARFEKIWFMEYSNQFLNFSNESDVRAYSFLGGSISLMTQIEKLNDSLNNLTFSSGVALGNYPIKMQKTNQNILTLTRELLGVLNSFHANSKTGIFPISDSVPLNSNLD